jgi:phosphomevalonate kinase
VLQNLIEARQTFIKIRELLRKMSDLAEVPIEPKEQTEILDASMDVPGVLLAGVPGGKFLHITILYSILIKTHSKIAGGYDALFCLVIGTETKLKLEQCWSNFTGLRACPLLAKNADFGIQVERQ